MTIDEVAERAVATWSEQLVQIETDSGDIAFFEAGDGHTVILLHGIPTHSWLWRDVAAIISRGHRVIAPDLLGFGYSDKREGIDLSPSSQADAILDVLGRLGIESYSLVGHDYGALVACEMLARGPERVDHLVLLNTSLRLSDWSSTSLLNPLSVLKVPVAGEAALKISRPAILRKAFTFFVDEPARLDEETMALYWHPFTDGFDRTLIRLARENRLDEDTLHAWKAALYDYTGPSLVVWGANDPAFRVDRAHEIVGLLKDCRFEFFVHSNHFIQEDRPTALGRLIASFVEGHLRD